MLNADIICYESIDFTRVWDQKTKGFSSALDNKNKKLNHQTDALHSTSASDFRHEI